MLKNILLVGSIFLSSQPVFAQEFLVEDVATDLSFQGEAMPYEEQARRCARFCKERVPELQSRSRAGESFRCYLDSETRGFARGDYRPVATGCKVIRTRLK